MFVPPATVRAYLGLGEDRLDDTQVNAALDIVEQMVKAYTRGAGFTDYIPDPPLAAVIVTATARLVTNPTGTVLEQTGPFVHRPSVFDGWTLPELAVLNRYRRRAA